ncbi:hypothetical protein MTO96_047159, partial [Rhipicephalus appendiculatus]
MDPEQPSDLEEPDLFMVACIDFSGSSDPLHFMPMIRTAEILDEIK